MISFNIRKPVAPNPIASVQCVSKSVAHNMNTSICSRKVMHSTILSENRHMHRKRIIKELSFFILGPEVDLDTFASPEISDKEVEGST